MSSQDEFPSYDPLLATLLDLLFDLEEHGADIPLILGGGYGLYLKQQHLAVSNARRLFEFLPPARSTDDIDVFLRTEIIADSDRLKPLRAALDRLGFTVISSARNYQFARKFRLGGRDQNIKIDLLTRHPDRRRYPHLEVDERRVKPRPSVGLHAHTTVEAAFVEEENQPLTLSGKRTNGAAFTGMVYLPQTYPFLMMKLCALRDQAALPEKGYGRKHALDLYTLAALLTEAEYEQTQLLSARHRASAEAGEAGRIVAELFASEEALGALRLRENEDLPASAGIVDFLSVLREFFPSSRS